MLDRYETITVHLLNGTAVCGMPISHHVENGVSQPVLIVTGVIYVDKRADGQYWMRRDSHFSLADWSQMARKCSADLHFVATAHALQLGALAEGNRLLAQQAQFNALNALRGRGGFDQYQAAAFGKPPSDGTDIVDMFKSDGHRYYYHLMYTPVGSFHIEGLDMPEKVAGGRTQSEADAWYQKVSKAIIDAGLPLEDVLNELHRKVDKLTQ